MFGKKIKNILIIFLSFIFLINYSFCKIKNEKKFQEPINQEKQDIKNQEIDNKKSFAQDKNINWGDVEKKFKNSVVQIFCQAAFFNFFEPYKAPEQYEGRGSGFFINDQGYILTNFHVVKDAYTIEIQHPSLGKERYKADVIACCPAKDIALIKLKERSLNSLKKDLLNALDSDKISYVELGDSYKLERTQSLMVLGYPEGQENIKSSIGEFAGVQDMDDVTFGQTTAPINPGNSGGPCFNGNGKVIGIATAKIVGADNIGYFILINDVKNIITDILNGKIQNKLIKLPFWGFITQYNSKDMCEYLKNPADGGVYISNVFADSIFDKNGILKGDVLYSINNNKIDRYGYITVDWCVDKITSQDLLNGLDFSAPVEIVIYRNGEKFIKNIKRDFDLEAPIEYFYTQFEDFDYDIIGGMVIEELTLNYIDILKEGLKYIAKNNNLFVIPSILKYELPENKKSTKLVIANIIKGSPVSEDRSLFPGSVIEEVNGIKVNTLQEFRDTILSNTKDYLTIKTETGGFLAIKIDKILEQEDSLAKRNCYNRTKLSKELERLF